MNRETIKPKYIHNEKKEIDENKPTYVFYRLKIKNFIFENRKTEIGLNNFLSIRCTLRKIFDICSIIVFRFHCKRNRIQYKMIDNIYFRTTYVYSTY